MSRLPDVITLGPEEEARRLWQGALEARERAEESLVSLCEALDLGARAVEILVVRRLQPVKDQFPATLGLLLETPNPEVDVHRDALVSAHALQLADAVDLLSEESLECVSPKLHRGWEDRRFSCRRSRRKAQEAIGLTLDAGDQDQLLRLAAYRNRIFRYPPPVRVVPGEIMPAFDRLADLAARLFTD